MPKDFPPAKGCVFSTTSRTTLASARGTAVGMRRARSATPSTFFIVPSRCSADLQVRPARHAECAQPVDSLAVGRILWLSGWEEKGEVNTE